MTDKIGAVEIEILSVFTFADRSVRLRGDLPTEINRTQLEEMFRDSNTGGFNHGIWGGKPIWEDFTALSRYTQYCIFDSDRLKDGWYGLIGFRKGEDVTTLYPYEVRIVFIGTSAQVINRLQMLNFAEVTNDWSI